MIYFGEGSDWNYETDGIPMDSCTIVEIPHSNPIVKSPHTGDTGAVMTLMTVTLILAILFVKWRIK